MQFDNVREMRDPGSWQRASSAAEMRSEMNRARFEREQRTRDEYDTRTGPPAAEPSKRWSIGAFLRSPLGMGLIAFGVVFGALLLINPPLVQEARARGSAAEPRANLWIVALWAGIVGVLVAASPYVARYLSLRGDVPYADEPRESSRHHRRSRHHRSHYDEPGARPYHHPSERTLPPQSRPTDGGPYAPMRRLPADSLAPSRR